jgi:predicted O-methyltransferase YrrM
MFHDWYTHPHYNQGDNGAFHEHMPTLRLMCGGMEVVELGSRFGTSTLAILTSVPKALYTVDIERRETITTLLHLAEQENIPFTFVEDNDLTCYVPECDILFIDTLHTYSQLKQELALHADKASTYIVMHDIVSFGTRNEDDNPVGGQGLMPAINEFLETNPHWVVCSYYYNCNGLLILKRI